MAGHSLQADVSRETFEKLSQFHALVIKWSQTINLVSKSSIPDLWDRHIWDSAQIAMLCPKGAIWVDIGSGGGFPGLVVAILSSENQPARQTIMIESDTRKSAFLRTVIRELDLNATVLTDRIEDVLPQNADVLSARALAELPQLLEYADLHLSKSGTALFMKGASWEKEVRKAQDSWSFTLKTHKSVTNPSAAVLEIKDIQRV